jgi:transposase-like protein
MASSQTYDITLLSLLRRFGSDDDCRAALEDARWPDGIACLRCGSTSISRISTRDQLDCNPCRYRFSATTGTIFHDSKLPLSKWFLALYMITESKKGVSANQLSRMLEVSYKTAWYLSHRIREALKLDNPKPLTGTVEVDETWIGGEVRGKGKGYVDNKTMVVGAAQRGGEVRMEAGGRATKERLTAFVRRNVSPDATAIYTDDSRAYPDFTDANTKHERVAHKQEEWVRGDVQTNTVEGAWSLFNRGVVGAFHHVSEKHLNRYFDEFEFRYNNRSNRHIFRDALIELARSGTLEYKQLTA